jgi:hypothetical protein
MTEKLTDEVLQAVVDIWGNRDYDAPLEPVFAAMRAVLAPVLEPPPYVMEDGTTLTRSGWLSLIDGNIEWLEAQPRTLERDHILDMMKWARDHREFYESRAVLAGRAETPQEPKTCATCKHWLPEDRANHYRAQCGMGVSGATPEKSSHHPYPITRRDFGCALHEPTPTAPEATP